MLGFYTAFAREMEVADYIGIIYDNARQALSRYQYQRLLNRRKGVYTIIEKGLLRIIYLRSEETTDDT